MRGGIRNDAPKERREGEREREKNRKREGQLERICQGLERERKRIANRDMSVRQTEPVPTKEVKRNEKES